MPIKGMTDRKSSFPEIGQLRKGAKKTSEKLPGADLKYFRPTFDDQETESQETFFRLYGSQPQEVNILLPFNEIERVWDAWFEAYTAGSLIARTDGEFYEYLIGKGGEVLVKNGLDKNGNKKPYTEGDTVGTDYQGKPVFCKPSGRLKVVIPELQRLAYMTVLTTSIHDVINISSQLEAIKEMNGGRIAGIPLVLRRRPKKISTPSGKDGRRARREKWLISVEADPQWVKAKLLEMKTLALPGNGLSEYEKLSLPESAQNENVFTDDDIETGYDYEEDDDEIIEGETEDVPEPEQPPAPEPQQLEDPKPVTRPMDAETLKSMLIKKAGTFKNATCSDQDRNMLAANLEMCFAGPSATSNRKTIMRYLFGTASTKEISCAEVLSAKRWLKVTQDSGGEWLPDAMAVKEANKCLVEANKADGQETLI